MAKKKKPTIDQALRSVNGFDQIAVQQKFRAPISELNSMMAIVALEFVALRHAGSNDQDAYNTAMSADFGSLADKYEVEDAAGWDDEPENPEHDAPGKA